MKIFFIIPFIFSLLLAADFEPFAPFYNERDMQQAQEALAHMSLEQKIRLLVVPAFWLNSSGRENECNSTEELAQTGILGVLLLGNGTKEKAREIISRLQTVAYNAAQEPLLIFIDSEWGRQRLTDAVSTPQPYLLSTTDLASIEEYGYAIGKELNQELGIHVNLAPVCEISEEPSESNAWKERFFKRTFGTNPQEVASRSYAFAKGLLHAGILPCAKHFPGGHAQSVTDPHKHEAIVNVPLAEFTKNHLQPFVDLIEAGIPAIMIGHVTVPCLDDEPASVSQHISLNLLKNLGFNGLCITDSLKMSGVSEKYTTEQLAVKAFQAGAHILLRLANTQDGINGLEEAVKSGSIREESLNERVLTILTFKFALLRHANQHLTC